MKKYLTSILIVFLFNSAHAQQWDIGGNIGLANYFGDLNTTNSFANVRPSGGLTARNYYNRYIALRVFFNVGKLEGSDIGSINPYEAARKLDFQTNWAEVGTQLEFNFMKYYPGKDKHYFAAYSFIGLSVFVFDPKGTLEGFPPQSLEFYTTEGQGIADYPERRKYSLVQPVIPFGMGIKYKINFFWNFAFEVGYRKMFTDYLDDVSTTYIDPYYFDTDFAASLADKSRNGSETPIGIEGKQRGDSQYTDAYLLIGVYLTYTIRNKRCPPYGR